MRSTALRRTLVAKRAVRRLLVVGGLLAVVTACGDETPAPTAITPTPTATASTPAPSSAPNLKAMLHGLIDRDGPPAAAFSSVVSNFVVNVNWSDLQPAPGALVTNNAIDRAIAAARQMNAIPGHASVGVKIRMYAGVDAPNWVKQLAGGPVQVVSGSLTGTIGRFWTDAFGTAYTDVWTRMAQRYDSVPEIREIVVSRCMTFYAETMIRDTADPVTERNLLNAGYTMAADRACITQEIDLGAVWHTTRIGVAFNPYELVVPGVHISDESFTEEMMQHCRSQLGPQCVLENNSIRFPLLPGLYRLMYAAMIRLGAPLSFQTATLSRVGDLTQTLNWAVTAGANAVELPKGYTTLPTTTLASVAAALPASST